MTSSEDAGHHQVGLPATSPHCGNTVTVIRVRQIRQKRNLLSLTRGSPLATAAPPKPPPQRPPPPFPMAPAPSHLLATAASNTLRSRLVCDVLLLRHQPTPPLSPAASCTVPCLFAESKKGCAWTLRQSPPRASALSPIHPGRPLVKNGCRRLRRAAGGASFSILTFYRHCYVYRLIGHKLYCCDTDGQRRPGGGSSSDARVFLQEREEGFLSAAFGGKSLNDNRGK